ncbi:MAG: penicillin-binding protein 2, partial [Actinobacteria bacterium]|nr:penicillin-binding protein 2 [Actinomycetota bacterium]
MTARASARRIVALFGVFVLGLTGICVRLVWLQVKDANAFQALARDQRLRAIELPAPRGNIFDRDSHELAMSLPAAAVYADPTLVKDPASTARALAPLLHMPVRDVRAKIAGPGRFTYLARGLDDPVADRIRALKLPGIGFLDESRRHYPSGPVAPQVLGFVGIDGVGLAGIEKQYQTQLAGRPGEMIREQDPDGRGIPQAGTTTTPPVPGADVVLTIDREVQFATQRLLVEAVRENHAKGGTALVMDPRTGEILALADYPWYDPNRFSQARPEATRAKAITDVFEPGSVNKVITAAAAIEEELFALDTSWPIPDAYLVGGHLFHDSHPHPVQRMTLADIIAYSSNVGTIQTAARVQQPRLARYLARFGYGRKTGVTFPGESPGILPPQDEWWATGMGSIPIGQGVAVTPLQMACVYATIANGGEWVQPTLVRGFRDGEGTFHAAPAPERRRVVRPDTAARVTEMLAYAVQVGTGTEADIERYHVAGKTGTARKPLKDARGYSDQYVASFIGFFPASAPRLVIAAILDEPDTVYG